MPMKPHKDESQSDFMHRCMSETFTGDRSQEQAVAICMNYWRDEKGGSKPSKSAAEVQRIIKLWCRLLKAKALPDPADYDDRAEFMSDCIEEVDDEEACAMHWEESGEDDDEEKRANGLVHKAHAGTVNGVEYILSDESVDRLGDVIMADGWSLESFKKNPVALFNHRSDFVIGKWNNLRVVDRELRGHLELAPEGTSDRIDEIRKLVEAGILRAVSVGFRSLKHEPLNPNDRSAGMLGGMRYLKSELVETSLVSIPANANALAVAKSLRISPATMDLVFAGQGNEDKTIHRRGLTGGQAKAATKDAKGSRAMNTLAQRITDLQGEIGDKKAALEAHLAAIDDSNVSDSDLEVTTKFNSEIAQKEKTLQSLLDSEKILAKGADDGKGGRAPNGGGNGSVKSRALATVHSRVIEEDGSGAPIIMLPGGRKKTMDPIDYLVHAGVVAYAAKSWGKPPDEVRQQIYGDDEGTKLMTDLVVRAASAPALTTVTGWAAELVQQTYADLMPLLMPKAVMTRLAAKGLALNFGRAGRINIPTRSRTPTIAGSFVGEGMPIPVRQGAFTSQALTPKKMAVITTWTREMSEHSIPAIEGLLREAIREDTTVAIDSVLLDSVAATTIRPAGILNGVAAITATAGGGIAAVVGDIKALVGALTTATYGNIRSPVWLMNPTDMLSLMLINATNTGIFPFAEEVRGGTLAGIPIIDSSTVVPKTVILMDAADFVTVGGAEAMRMEMSDQATLHMEDTTPAEINGGSPATAATPVRSLWQTDSLALRMILPLNWLNRRTGMVAWTQNVTWM